jgi:hypothetical protein
MQKSPQIIDGHGFLCGFEKENAFNVADCLTN